MESYLGIFKAAAICGLFLLCWAPGDCDLTGPDGSPMAYRIGVITDPFLPSNNDSDIRMTKDRAQAVFAEAISFQSRRRTRFQHSTKAKSSDPATTTTVNGTAPMIQNSSDSNVHQFKIEATFVVSGSSESMHETLARESEVAKGQLIALLDVAECSARKCSELHEMIDLMAGLTLFTSCCYTNNGFSRVSEAHDDDYADDDGTVDEWFSSSHHLPDVIYDGIQPSIIYSFIEQLSKQYNWRRFYFVISPNLQMYDRFSDELFAYFKAKNLDIVFTKGFFCTEQLAKVSMCSHDQAKRLILHKATVVILLLDNKIDLLNFLKEVSDIGDDSLLNQGKALIFVELDNILAPLIGDILHYAPPGFMLFRRKPHAFRNFQTKTPSGVLNADSASQMYTHLRMLSPAIDAFAADPQRYQKVSALFCGSKISFEDSANNTINYSGHCDNEDIPIEIWNVKPSDDSVWFDKVLEMSPKNGLRQVGQPFWLGSRWSTPIESQCDFDSGHCPPPLEKVLPGSVVGAVVLVIATVFGTIYVCRRTRKRMEIKLRTKQSVILNFNDLEFLRQDEEEERPESAEHHGSSHNNSLALKEGTGRLATPHRSRSKDMSNNQDLLKNGKTVVAKLAERKVFVSLLSSSFCIVDDQLVQQLLQMKALHHANVNPFFGTTPDVFHICALHEYCAKGTLAQVLARKTLQLNKLFKVSFASDIAAGMGYLHQSSILSHGELTSSNIFVDARWFCKISNIPLPTLKDEGASTSSLSNHQSSVHSLKQHSEMTDPIVAAEPAAPIGMVWTAPELLRLPAAIRPSRGSQKGDIYSYAIVLFEIATRHAPFTFYNLPEKVILSRVRDGIYPPFRPQCHPEQMPNDVAELLDIAKHCWDEVPVFRPNFQNILKSLQKINNGKDTQLVDEMIVMMENYAENLEATVNARTQELVDEQRRSEQLLSKMLPRSIIVELKAGHIVHPETFDSVTVYFSDIVGFTKLAAESSALEIVNFLNDLYSEFDLVIDSYNVYKVETIGDAYMVASGLPIRNKTHAAEIATLALDMLSRVTTFYIRHRPDRFLQLRIGIHSGSVVAGIVGLKMPRYCLFGDTVNYASRMESSGLALRIHVSPDTKALLDETGGFKLERRGFVTMKGKGSIETYYLVGKDGFTRPLPDLRLAASIEEHEFK